MLPDKLVKAFRCVIDLTIYSLCVYAAYRFDVEGLVIAGSIALLATINAEAQVAK